MTYCDQQYRSIGCWKLEQEEYIGISWEISNLHTLFFGQIYLQTILILIIQYFFKLIRYNNIFHMTKLLIQVILY